MVRLPTQTQGPELAAAMRETEGMRAAPAVGVARRSISDIPVYQPECSNECQKRQVVYYRELGKNRMRAPFRKWLTLLCSLLVLGVLVASGSRVLDKWISILVWSACLIGSVILLIKYARRPPENRGFYFGQAALLPRGWQRWLAGEEGTPKTEDHPSAGKPDRERQ